MDEPPLTLGDLFTLLREATFCTIGDIDRGALGVIFETLDESLMWTEEDANVVLRCIVPAADWLRDEVRRLLLAAGWGVFDRDEDANWITYSNLRYPSLAPGALEARA